MGNEAVPSTIAACALDALGIGVIVTDSRAHVVYANAAADRLLCQVSGGLRRCNAGKVSAACYETRINLANLIAQACGGELRSSGGHVRVPALDRNEPDLAVCILPVASAGAGEAACRDAMHAIMLVRPIERACNLEVEAQCLLGLSKAEARLASGLAGGLSLQEAADARAVTLETARSHLKSIFRKTGLNRQSQLVALLRSTQIPIEATRREATHHKSSKNTEARARALPLSA